MGSFCRIGSGEGRVLNQPVHRKPGEGTQPPLSGFPYSGIRIGVRHSGHGLHATPLRLLVSHGGSALAIRDLLLGCRTLRKLSSSGR